MSAGLGCTLGCLCRTVPLYLQYAACGLYNCYAFAFKCYAVCTIFCKSTEDVIQTVAHQTFIIESLVCWGSNLLQKAMDVVDWVPTFRGVDCFFTILNCRKRRRSLFKGGGCAWKSGVGNSAAGRMCWWSSSVAASDPVGERASGRDAAEQFRRRRFRWRRGECRWVARENPRRMSLHVHSLLPRFLSDKQLEVGLSLRIARCLRSSK